MSQSRMDEAILRELEEHHARIRAGIDDIRRHCEAPVPDMMGLSDARLRLSRASTARSTFYTAQVVPKLRERMIDQTELTDMQRAFGAKRLKSSEHVVAWPFAAIEKDWPGYRAAAKEIWAMMEEQMNREIAISRRYLKPR
jgi:hypothetical protein